MWGPTMAMASGCTMNQVRDIIVLRDVWNKEVEQQLIIHLVHNPTVPGTLFV